MVSETSIGVKGCKIYMDALELLLSSARSWDEIDGR